MTTAIDPVLAPLSNEALSLVEDQLSNNDVSGDEALETFFVEQGLTELQARHALRFRSLYLCHIFLEGHTPILAGKNALRFNPHLGTFELFQP